MTNQMFKAVLPVFALTLGGLLSVSAQAQQRGNIDDVRWKSEEHVRSLYGEPNSIRGPVGTHASYTLWKYDNFTVAFANSRVFHLFDSNSMKKMKLEENR